MSKYKKLLDDALQKQSDLQKKYEHFERTGNHFAEMNEMIYANAIELTLISYQHELDVIMKIYYKLNDDGIAIYTAHKIDFYHLNKKNQSGKLNQSTHASENRHDASLASIKEENSAESSGGRRRTRTLRKKRTKRNRA